MFKIFFIDEQQDDIDAFNDYVDENNLSGEFEVTDMFPLNDLNEMIMKIMKSGADAVVTDYMLNEIKTEINYNVPYTGAELVKKLLGERVGFPCFVLTSFDDQAIHESNDVNLVYIKGILHETEKDSKAKATFLDRVKNQILHHRKLISNAEERLLSLIEKNENQSLDCYEEEELIELDSLIESSLDKPSRVPNRIKNKEVSNTLIQMLNKVDELAKKVTKNED